MPPFPALTGPSYRAASAMADYERCVGFFLEKNAGPGATYSWSLLSLPGLTAVATVAEAPGRGIWAMDGRCLRASGAAVYEVDSGYVHTFRGTVPTDGSPVFFTSSGDAGAEVAMASVGSVFIFDLSTNTFTGPIASLTAHQIGYLDNYFIGLNRTTSTVRISNPRRPDVDPTQFAQRSSAPDKGVRCWGVLYPFGSETSDVWYARQLPVPVRPGGRGTPRGDRGGEPAAVGPARRSGWRRRKTG
jgi:hypothetical protein